MMEDFSREELLDELTARDELIEQLQVFTGLLDPAVRPNSSDTVNFFKLERRRFLQRAKL